MKPTLQSFNLHVIFIIPIAFKSFEEKKQTKRKRERGGQSKMHLDSFVDSLTVAFGDFKSKFYALLVHNMNALSELNKSNKEKLCSQKIIQLPQSKCFSYGIFQGA